MTPLRQLKWKSTGSQSINLKRTHPTTNKDFSDHTNKVPHKDSHVITNNKKTPKKRATQISRNKMELKNVSEDKNQAPGPKSKDSTSKVGKPEAMNQVNSK